MATYQPPIENLPIFDPSVFTTGNEALTYDEASKLFLKYPSAQGTEDLQAINVNGIATFNSDIIQNGSETNNIVQNTRDTNTNENIFRKTDIYGDLNLRRPNTTNGGAMRLWDVNGTTGNSSQLYNTGTQFAIVNLNNSGQITLNTKDSGGNSVQPLIATATYLQGLKQLLMSGTLNTDRIINNCYYQLQDINALTTTTGQIYAGSGVFNYDNDSNGGTHNFATNTSAGVQTIPLSFNSVDMNIGTTNAPTCNASSTIATSDNSAKIPSTAWVRSYVATIPPPVSTQYTYTQQFSGASSLTAITIPTGCVKFDIKVFGTGGLAGGTNANPPSGPYPDYYLTMGGAGGGAGVAYKEGIPIIKQGTGFTNTISYDNSSGTSASGYCEILLNSVSLCKAYNGGTASLSAGGAGCSTAPVVNTTWGNWVYWNGQTGSGASTSMSSPDTGQVGGGCQNGGIAGNGNISSSSSLINSGGQGQRYSALTGPTYGFPSYSASPINRGGCIITWYIQS